ncbi:MAG: hypothetical protein JNL11_09940 [Bdellovibrionaceae bacterium]|nr:hypothetical protein [Pseudobdellovibrionaceae bacterium]
MKMKLLVAGVLLLSAVVQAGGKVFRATDMGTTTWSDLAKGKLGDVVVEFRQGDEVPITFEAQGDLVETKQASVNYVGIKRNFWLRLSQNDIEISMDGTTFKKLNEVLTGSLEAGAGSAQNGGVADAITIMFKAFLK